MRTIVKTAHKVLLLTTISCATIFISCEKVDRIEAVISEKETISELKLKSDITHQSSSDDYEVTQKMAEVFITSNKENPPIVSIESYCVDGISCFYIINLDHGYKIISADARVQPILAESDRDSFYPDRIENEGIKIWLEDTANRILVLKRNNPEVHEDHSATWENLKAYECNTGTVTRSLDPNQDYVWIKTIDTQVTDHYSNNILVSHLTETLWSQGAPWNSSMPVLSGVRCKVGCVAVAIAQILYYFNGLNGTPNDLWHNISISNFNTSNKTVTLSKSSHTNNSMRWMLMPVASPGTYTSYVSDLMLDIGERISMHYGTSKSSVNLNTDISIPNISQCGISSSFSSFNYSYVSSNINEGRPVIITASKSSSSSDYHTWLIDGCSDYVNKITETVSYLYVPVEDVINHDNWVASYSDEDMHYLIPNVYDGMQVNNTYFEHIQFLRMNWGVGGEGYDSYYGILDSSDWNVNNGNDHYNYKRVIHYNITTSQLN